MARSFKEVAHLRTDLEKYGDGYDRIFKKQQAANGDANQPSDEPPTANKEDEIRRIKELAKSVYYEVDGGQDTEGFPESSSFIYGFTKGYQAAKDGK